MTLLGLFLTMIGAADLARYGTSGAGMRRRIGAVAVAAIVGLLGFWGLGRPVDDLAVLLLGVLLITFWIFAAALSSHRSERFALGGLTAGILALLGFGQHLGVTDGWLQSWYSSLTIDGLADVRFDQFALAFGCFLVLQNTANLIVRLVLDGAGPGVSASAKTLKGGRILGPLERSFIFAMALSGQFTAVGAVIAAKSILRFPEISRADDDGDMAEYVLVGSFASWVLALVFIPLF